MPMSPAPPVTVETVQKETADVLVERIFLRLVDKVHEGSRNERFEEEWAYVDSLSPGLQMLWSTTLLEEEIFNGGVEQYFWNSSHWYVEQALRDLPLIGAVDQLRILRTAVDVVRQSVPDTKWRDPAWRSVLHAAGPLSELNALSDEYCALDPTVDDYQRTYIDRHRSEFVLD